jgi:hypothetical protein
MGVSAAHNIALTVDVCCASSLLLQFVVFTFHTTVLSSLCFAGSLHFPVQGQTLAFLKATWNGQVIT